MVEKQGKNGIAKCVQKIRRPLCLRRHKRRKREKIERGSSSDNSRKSKRERELKWEEERARLKNRINILEQQLGELQNKISRDRKKEKTDTKPRKMQSGGENSGKETPREISDTPRIPGNPGEKDSREATINIELGNSTDSATISEPVQGKPTRIQKPSKLTKEEFDGEMQERNTRKK